MFCSQPQNEIFVCVAGLVERAEQCVVIPSPCAWLWKWRVCHSSLLQDTQLEGMNKSPSWPHKWLGCRAKPLLLPLAVFFPFSQLFPVVYSLLALRPSLIEETQTAFGVGVFLRAEFRSRLSVFMGSCSSRDEGRQQGCRAVHKHISLPPAPASFIPNYLVPWHHCLFPFLCPKCLPSAVSPNTDPFGCFSAV